MNSMNFAQNANCNNLLGSSQPLAEFAEFNYYANIKENLCSAYIHWNSSNYIYL